MKVYKRNSVISTRLFISDNKFNLLFMTLFTLGVTIGSTSFLLMRTGTAQIFSLLTHYFEENKALSVIEIFARNMIANLLYLVCIYISGLCAIGLPMIMAVPIIKGISLGIIISYLYIFSGIKGFLYAFIILCIPNALLMSIYNYAFVEGLYMSLTVSNGAFNGKPRQMNYNRNFLTFTKRYILITFGVVIVCLSESVLSSVFSKVL